MSDNKTVQDSCQEKSEADRVVRFLFEDSAVRGVWVNLQKSCADMLALKAFKASISAQLFCKFTHTPRTAESSNRNRTTRSASLFS